jgi:phenylacetate-CoA ligase
MFYYPLTQLKGERIALYLEEARKFQWLDSDHIAAYQLSSLKDLISYAVDHSHYYMRTLRPNESNKIQSVSDLAMLPMIDKNNLIDNFGELCSSKKFLLYSKKTTGGSTGQAVTIKKNSDALARERAVTARSYEWAHVGLCDPQARLWGIPLEYENRLYYRLVDLVANRRRFSAFNLNAESMGNYLSILEKYQPKYLYGYASAIEEFARFVYHSGRKLPRSLSSIICTSEVLTPELRDNIINFTGINPFNEYGCGEVGSIAHECEHHNLHIMAENLIVELLDDSGKPSNKGEIVVTDLHNYAMPLLRYRLKDFGEFLEHDCICGRKLPALKKIHGRAYDFVVKPDGTKIHPELIMYIFEALKREGVGVLQFQVIQKDVNDFEARLVVSDSFDESQEALTKARLKEVLWEGTNIKCQYGEALEREASGKLRLIKSEVER